MSRRGRRTKQEIDDELAYHISNDFADFRRFAPKQKDEAASLASSQSLACNNTPSPSFPPPTQREWRGKAAVGPTQFEAPHPIPLPLPPPPPSPRATQQNLHAKDAGAVQLDAPRPIPLPPPPPLPSPRPAQDGRRGKRGGGPRRPTPSPDSPPPPPPPSPAQAAKQNWYGENAGVVQLNSPRPIPLPPPPPPLSPRPTQNRRRGKISSNTPRTKQRPDGPPLPPLFTARTQGLGRKRHTTEPEVFRVSPAERELRELKEVVLRFTEGPFVGFPVSLVHSWYLHHLCAGGEDKLLWRDNVYSKALSRMGYEKVDDDVLKSWGFGLPKLRDPELVARLNEHSIKQHGQPMFNNEGTPMDSREVTRKAAAPSSVSNFSALGAFARDLAQTFFMPDARQTYEAARMGPNRGLQGDVERHRRYDAALTRSLFAFRGGVWNA